MTAFAYVGTAEDAAGFRLAGMRCWTPRGDEADALRAALVAWAPPRPWLYAAARRTDQTVAQQAAN
jgi:hypothetical protein